MCVRAWQWHHAVSIMTGTPPQPPLQLAVAPDETPPPRESNEWASRPEPEGPPAQREKISHNHPPSFPAPSTLCTWLPAHLGPAFGDARVCGDVRRRNVHCKLVHSVDGLQESFLTLGFRTTRQLLDRGGDDLVENLSLQGQISHMCCTSTWFNSR